MYLCIRCINVATSLTPLPFIEVPVPSKESDRSCICVLGLSMLPRSTIF